MELLYVITILAVYILFMLIHKTEKKQNVIVWMAISAILVLCYNIFICVICTFINILCILQNLSICNVIAITLLLVILLKNKKVQKYYIKISDIIFGVLLLILVIFIAYKQYGYPTNIKYKTTDGSSHYFFATKFYENQTLLYKQITGTSLGVANLDFRLPGAYINEGILFRIFDGIVSKINLFIIFDLAVLYMSGILVFYLLKAYAKENKKLHILAAIFSIIYMLGYQLNSMQYGYVYLSLALDIILAFLLLMEKCEKEKISNKIALPILSLISFGIFFLYAYFIPIIYISIIINIIIKARRKKEKILSEQNIIKVLMLIINPLILGVTYFIILPLTKGIETEISTIILEGAIYKNYITNLLPFIIIFILRIVSLIKNKNKENKQGFSTILFMLSIIFAIILFIGNKLEKVSQYYFFKAYYIIWPLAIINAYIALSEILEDKDRILKIVTYTYVSTYIITILISTLILKKNIWINDIFYQNAEYATDGTCTLKNGELKILEKVEDKIKNNEIYILNPDGARRTKWINIIHQNENIFNEQKYWGRLTIEEWVEQGQKRYYLAYYQDINTLELEQNLPDENSNEYKIIYNDEYAFILERK